MKNLAKLAAGAVLLTLIYALPMDAQTTGTTKGKAQKVTGKEVPLGTIEFELYAEDAPKTVENFVKLADRKYFNGVIFHRVSKGFVVQAGDPTGTGTGGKSIWGKDFADELNPNTASYKEGYKRGVLAMANKGPNTNSSQFFIMLQDNMRMPKNYTIFGKVVKGMDVVDKIADSDIIPQMGPTDGKPKQDIVMKTVTVVKQSTPSNSKEPKPNPRVKVEVIRREPAGQAETTPTGNK
jgi:cyclophilin family peptidyl-prolyl cis-trans isomerase